MHHLKNGNQQGGRIMITITLGKLAQLIGGKLRTGRSTTPASSCNFGYSKDIYQNQVYFYTKKTSWEKQLYAIQKFKPLAVVLPYSISVHSIPSSTAVIHVKDSYTAFWKIAAWNWQKHSVKTIGITG